MVLGGLLSFYTSGGYIDYTMCDSTKLVGGRFQIFFIFTPIPGEMIQFDEHIFQMGWFNHQPENEQNI